MALFTIQPTANQTPDATLGGSAVTNPSNTGHDSTLTESIEAGILSSSCRWFNFQNVGGQIISAVLKITHSSQGVLVGPTPHNGFTLSYSLNGGGSWTDAVARTDFTTLQSGTFSVTLANNQDLTQVQVRDFMQANADVDETASTTATISSIQVEVTTTDPQVIALL